MIFVACNLRFPSSVAIFSLDAARSDAVSFGLSFVFGRCLFQTFFLTMRGSDAVAYPRTRLFWTLSLLGTVSFFGRSSFGRCLFRTLFCVQTLSLSDFLSDDVGF